MIDLVAVPGAVQDLLGDADLLQILLVGVGVIAVHDDGGVMQRSSLVVHPRQDHKVLVMVVGVGLAVIIDIAPQDGVGEWIARALDLPVAIDEGMGALSGTDGVHHHRKVAAGGVFHSHRDVQAAGGQTVLLVFDAARTDRHVRDEVGQEMMVLGIQHLVGAGEAELVDGLHMHPADGQHALDDIGIGCRVRLMEHSLVPCPCRAGLVGIDARNYDYLVLNFVLDGTQAADVIQHSVLPVGRAGADDQKELVGRAAEDVLYLPVILLLGRRRFGRDGIHVLDLLGAEQFPLEYHIHTDVIYQNIPSSRWRSSSFPAFSAYHPSLRHRAARRTSPRTGPSATAARPCSGGTARSTSPR